MKQKDFLRFVVLYNTVGIFVFADENEKEETTVFLGRLDIKATVLSLLQVLWCIIYYTAVLVLMLLLIPVS